jgi:hypothetical protein
MGTNVSKIAPTYFLIERVIVGHCDFIKDTETNIRIGVVGGKDDSQNPLSHQAICIGDSELYRLKSFLESQDQLKYTFEKDVSLTLMKSNASVLYNLKTSELDITREVDPIVLKFFKPIGMGTDELDKIGKLYTQLR